MESLRYTPPSRFDLAPYGTVCKVVQEDASHKLFVQISQEAESARWEPIGYLLTEAFSAYLEDPEFIKACLQALTNKEQINQIYLVLKK